MKQYFPALFKRRAFHSFKDVGGTVISQDELDDIERVYPSFKPLYKDIETAIRIVPTKDASYKSEAEYCILIYSEKKDNYLMNVGYIGEQLDLYLVSKNIGTLWFGFGRTKDKKYNGLDFVIMIAICKVEDESLFRKDMSEAKRKPIKDIWKGETLDVAEIARFAPSACNTQPWFVENVDNVLTVYRYRNPRSRGIVQIFTARYYNRIDIGIFLCVLEVCFAEKGIKFTRELFLDLGDKKTEYSKVCSYKLI